MKKIKAKKDSNIDDGFNDAIDEVLIAVRKVVEPLIYLQIKNKKFPFKEWQTAEVALWGTKNWSGKPEVFEGKTKFFERKMRDGTSFKQFMKKIRKARSD